MISLAEDVHRHKRVFEHLLFLFLFQLLLLSYLTSSFYVSLRAWENVIVPSKGVLPSTERGQCANAADWPQKRLVIDEKLLRNGHDFRARNTKPKI